MKISIISGAFAVTSSIKKEDFDLLKKYRPEDLKIYDDDGNEIFTLNYNENSPALERYGISFNGVSGAEATKGCLTYTGIIPNGVDAKEYVTDKVGICYDYLKMLEDEMAENVKAVKEARKKISDSITVA